MVQGSEGSYKALHSYYTVGTTRSEIFLTSGWMYVRSVAQSWPTLCDPMDCSPPGSSVHGAFQARTLEWVAISSFQCGWDLLNTEIEPVSSAAPALAGGFLPPSSLHHREAQNTQ